MLCGDDEASINKGMTTKIHGSFKNASCPFVGIELLQFVGQTKKG
jgi:hypothetical protein